MGFTQDDYKFMQKHVPIIEGRRICELGDQMFMAFDPKVDQTHTRNFYISNGAFYLSIDINAEGGAIPFDLNLPIEDTEILNSFDIITNFGTSEHVDNIYSCFRNIHNLCKPDGLMIHVVPSHNSWPEHGKHYFIDTTFEALSRVCGYDELQTFTRNCSFGGDDSRQVHCVLRKRIDSRFPEIDEWDSEINKYIFKE